MNYELFKRALLEEMDTLDSEYSHVIVQTKKDGNYQDFLIAEKPGSPNTPAIDLQGIYQAYQDQDIGPVAKIARMFYSHIHADELLSETGSNFEALKDKICCRLVDPRRYEALSYTPHVPYLDLAVIFYLDIEISGEDFRSYCFLRDNCLEEWNITEKELYAVAKKNTLKKNPFTVITPDEMFEESFPASMVRKELREIPSQTKNFCLITSSDNHFGATALLYPELFEKIANKMQCDLSIVLLEDNGIAVDPLEHLPEKQFVIRDMYHAYEDVLSDKVYCYHRNTGQISIFLNNHMHLVS